MLLKKILLATVALVLIAFLTLAGMAWSRLQPEVNLLELPDNLISHSGDRGQDLLQNANAKMDYAPLAENFESQELRSFCGVASGVAVLNALGRNIDQKSFFDHDSPDAKSRMDVTFGGMTLDEFATLLAAHGGVVEVYHADSIDVEAFREIMRRNLNEPGNYIVVNYQREELGQRRVGHISPVAAYDEESELVLILDTASYNYPPTWVPLTQLHEAMKAVDPSSGKSRGFVEVSGLAD